MTSAGAKLPTEPVEACPVKVTTEDPNPTKEPRVVSMFNPDKMAASFGTVTEPILPVTVNPDGKTAVHTNEMAVP